MTTMNETQAVLSRLRRSHAKRLGERPSICLSLVTLASDIALPNLLNTQNVHQDLIYPVSRLAIVNELSGADHLKKRLILEV